MTSSPLIAVPPSPASPAGATVAGNAWWPGIDRNAARDAIRMGEIITDARLTAALEGAWLTITSDLADWQTMLAAGFPNAIPPIPGPDSLADVTALQLMAMTDPACSPPWANCNPGAWNPGCATSPPTYPRYSPSRAAWLTSTMIDSATGTAVPNLVTLFTRAVRYWAAAELAESYRDFGMTTKGDLRAEAQTDTAGDYRRIALQAVRDILGVTRITSELI